MKTLFDQQVNVKFSSRDGKLIDNRLWLKISKNEGFVASRYEIELYDDRKMDFVYKRLFSKNECERIRHEQGIGEFDKFGDLLIDFIKNMKHSRRDWLQITENANGSIELELMYKRVGYSAKLLLRLNLPRIFGKSSTLLSKSSFVSHVLEEQTVVISSVGSEVSIEGFQSSFGDKVKELKNMFDNQNSVSKTECMIDSCSISFRKAKEFFEKHSTAGSKTLNTTYLSSPKVSKKYFDLFSLPLELQDMIVVEMVHNCPPDDWLYFAQTSKYSNWLVKRAKPKKIIDTLCIVSEEQRFDVEINKKSREMSEAEVLKLLQTCQIKWWSSSDDFFGVENKYWTPEFGKACFDSTRFLNLLTISFTTKSEVKCLKFYQNLQCLELLNVMDYVSNVLLLPKLPRDLYIGRRLSDFAQDDLPVFLINLAQKTRDCSLSYFGSRIKFDPSDVQQFLQNGFFHDRCSFVFHVDSEKRENFEKMFLSLGAKKSSSSEFRIPASNPSQYVGEYSLLLTF